MVDADALAEPRAHTGAVRARKAHACDRGPDCVLLLPARYLETGEALRAFGCVLLREMDDIHRNPIRVGECLNGLC